MRFRVICKPSCDHCWDEWLIDDSEIEVPTDQSAKEKFKARYRLCPSCLESGTQTAVLFDSYIHVDHLPNLGVEGS